MGNIDFSHGGDIHRLKGKHKGRVVDFSASINPLGLSKSSRKVILKNIDNVLHYPQPWAQSLAEKIASYWKIKKENILLGNGSCELIYLITEFFRPERAVIPAPTFSEYERALAFLKTKVDFIKLREAEGFKLKMPKARTDMLFVCNPNNPTGNLLIKREADFTAKITVIDEAFMDFLPDEKKHTFIHRACKDKNIIVLRSFTKFFALPGLRAGYLVAHPDLIKKLKTKLAPWSINIFAQKIAENILKDNFYISNTRKFIEAQKRHLKESLENIKGLKVFPSAANFFLARIEDKKVTSSFLKGELIKKGFLIRDCSNFRGLNNRYIRVAVRTQAQNKGLVCALKEVLGAYS